MTRAEADKIQNTLQTEWEPSITGRVQDVPQPPNILIAGTEEETRVNTAKEDVIFVRGPDSENYVPKSAGFSQKGRDVPMTVDIRTSHSRGRLVGVLDGSGNLERYGGLAGEVERILETIRKGDPDFDVNVPGKFTNQSEEVGYGHWRGTWDFTMRQIAENIDTTP